MCGIAGIINFNNQPVIAQSLKLMHQALAHRGPDDCGVYADNNIGLSHARLSIIDLAKSAHQPMHNEDETIWVVCNGEIYNYRDLKTPLLDKGHRFLCNCDTEILLHLYEEEGINFIHQLNGMFAFGLYDQKKHKVFLVRDRIGIKPLYYYFDGQRFLFASEIKAILTCPDVNRAIDLTAISEYLSLAYIPSPRSAFQKIRKLKAAEYLELDLATGKFALKSYWDFQPSSDHNEDEDEVSQRIMQLVSDSVRMQLVSDVPLGAFLSGGIDSSVVVALMAKLSNSRPKTFTIGFADEPSYDETFYARKVAQMYNTDHTEINLKYEDFIDKLPNILDSFDEPFADSSALPTYILSQATRKYVQVALSGDGGDELFAGYNKYLGMMLQRSPLVLPRISGPLLRTIFQASMEDFESKLFGRYARRLKRLLAGLGKSGADSYLSWMTQLNEDEKKRLVNFELKDGSGRKEIFDVVTAYYNKAKNSWINQASYTDLKFELVDDMLTKVDRMSMLASLEVRVPFLDHRVANEVLSLAGGLKIKNGQRKYILLKAAKQSLLLPKELYTRPKKGFEAPIGPWFKKNKKFQKLFLDCLQTKGKGQLINIDNTIRLFNLHQKTSVDYNRELWLLFVLKWWSDKYL